MIPFYPFIYEQENKKDEFELISLYIEIELPPPPLQDEEQEPSYIEIIDIL